MPDNQVKLVITTDATQAVAGMQKVRDGMHAMETDSGGVIGKIKQHWLGFSAALATVSVAVYKAQEYMMEGARAMQSEASLRNVAESYKVDADKMIADLTRVTNSTVDDSDLMQQAMKNMSAGMKPDDIIKLAEIARTASRRMGVDVGEAWRAISDAIETGRARQLAVYHLMTKDQAKLVEAAKAAGNEIDLMRIVMLNAAVQQEAFGNVTEDVVEKMQKQRAAFKSLKEEAGIYLNTLVYGIADVMKTLKDFGAAANAPMMAKNYREWAAETTDPKQKAALLKKAEEYDQKRPGFARGTFKVYDARGAGAAESPLDKAKRDLKEYEDYLKKLGKSKETKDNADELTKAQMEWKKSIDALNPSIDEETKKIDELNARAEIMKQTWAARLKIPDDSAKLGWIDEELKRGQEFINLAARMKRDADDLERTFKTFEEMGKRRAEMDRAAAEAVVFRLDREQRATENRITLERQLNEQRGRFGELSPRQIVESEADLERQLLDAARDRLTTEITERSIRDKTGEDEQRILSLAYDLRDVKKQILDLDKLNQYRLKEYTGTFAEGEATGRRKYVESFGTEFQQGERFARDSADAMFRAFDDGFFKLFKGEWDSMLDVVESFANDMARVLSRRFAEGAMDMIFGGSKGAGGTNLLSTLLSFGSSFLGFGSPATQSVEGIAGGLPYNAQYVPGPYASGGDFPAWEPMIVGERGPELMIPSAPGTVIPTGQFGNTLSVTVPVSIGPEHKRLAGIIQQRVEAEVMRVIREHT